MSNSRKHNINKEIQHLKNNGVILPRNFSKAAETVQEMRNMVTNPGQFSKDVSHFTKAGNASSPASAEVRNLQENASIISAMKHHRRVAGSSDVQIAIPRFYDPLEYWDLSGLPWNMADEGHRHKLHKWMRLFYATHYLVPILVDIFTRFPLVGMEFTCKDKRIAEFYEDLFMNDLDYENFLVEMGREYWLIGEAFSMGSFNENLGVWEREELINPEDVIVENFPLLGTSQLKVVPPEYLKRLATTRTPSKEYKQLEINFPELIPYLKKGEPFPVSDTLLKQVAFKTTSWDDHGTPIMLRGLRTLLHEEKLLASQDAIAERLYSPLILAKLGINDMGGNQGPWIPGPDQLENFRDDMDIALSSDFRLMVYHYALEVQNVFGREQVPDLGGDFDRIERRLMQVFGINPGLLSAGANAQPYASSALQAEFMNQMLRTFQNYLKKHFEQRALVVAEAQGHYEYEKRGNTRVPIMEEVVITDPETGEMRIEERHKLLIPDLDFATLDLRDEATERQFLANLRSMGAPISDEKMMVGVSFDFKDSLDEMQEEMIQKTVAQQQAKMQTYKILQAQGLPIPPDLKAEVESINAPAQPAGGAGGAPPPGGIGDMGAPGGAMVGAPAPSGGGGIVMPPPPGDLGPGGIGGAVPGGGAPPVAPLTGGPAGGAPDISSNRRPGMPTAASVNNEVDKTATKNDNANEDETLPWTTGNEKVIHDRVPKRFRESLNENPDEDDENEDVE